MTANNMSKYFKEDDYKRSSRFEEAFVELLQVHIPHVQLELVGFGAGSSSIIPHRPDNEFFPVDLHYEDTASKLCGRIELQSCLPRVFGDDAWLPVHKIKKLIKEMEVAPHCLCAFIQGYIHDLSLIHI